MKFKTEYQEIFNSLSEETKTRAMFGNLPPGFKNREYYIAFCSLPDSIQSQILRIRADKNVHKSDKEEAAAISDLERQAYLVRRGYGRKNRASAKDMFIHTQ